MPAFLDVALHLAGVGLLGGEVNDGHVGALAGEGDGSGAADARIAAGDERLAPFEAAVTFVAGLAVVGPGVHLCREPRRVLRLVVEGRLGVLGARVLHLEAVGGHDGGGCETRAFGQIARAPPPRPRRAGDALARRGKASLDRGRDGEKVILVRRRTATPALVRGVRPQE